MGRIRIWDGKTQSNSPKGGQFDRSIATKHEARQDARPLSSVILTGTERNSHRAQMRRIDIVLRKERSDFGGACAPQSAFRSQERRGRKCFINKME